MKKVAILFAAVLILFTNLSINASAAIQDAKLPETWSDMTLEEKIQHVIEMKIEFTLEYYYDIPSDIQNIGDYYGLILGITAKEFLDKYDIAFQMVADDDTIYLLLDFNDHDYMILSQNQDVRHYGEFTGDITTDLIVRESSDQYFPAQSYRYRADMILYTIQDDGTREPSGFEQCSIDNALAYLFALR